MENETHFILQSLKVMAVTKQKSSVTKGWQKNSHKIARKNGKLHDILWFSVMYVIFSRAIYSIISLSPTVNT
mgnify:CR=1 FL=1